MSNDLKGYVAPDHAESEIQLVPQKLAIGSQTTEGCQ